MIMGYMAAAMIGGSLLDTWVGSDSAHKANRTNIRLAREQRDFEERMSNTAVQRRADDFEKAGFNRLLAATGAGASTPTMSAPTVAPTTRSDIGGAVASAAQLRNLNAQTELTSQQARVAKVDADIGEAIKAQRQGYEANKYVEGVEQNDIKTAKDRLEKDMTAAQLAKFEATWPRVLELLNQQIKAGKLDLEALENIASIGGIEAGKMQGLLHFLSSLFRTAMKD